MRKFQSLTGRLQTTCCAKLHLPFAGFNPSQVGYKLEANRDNVKTIIGFNPSQVGYKRILAEGVGGILAGFNPSQVGYKPTRLLRVGPENEFKTVPIVKVRALPVGGFIIPHRCG